MTKKEIIEYLRQNMPNFTGTQEEKEVKTALYIYVELGKMKSFDEKYYFGNSKMKRKIYDLAEKDSRKIDEITNKRKIICVSLTHLYCSILKEFNIRAIPSEPEEDGHINPIIITKSKKVFVADLQLDLQNIQTKSRLEHFEYMGDLPKNRWKSSNQELLTKMLIEIGYIKDEKDYKNETIKKLKEKVKSMNPHDALRTICTDEELYAGNAEMEIIEANKFYKTIFKEIIPNFWKKKVYACNCYREKEEGERDYILCAYSEEDTIRPYLFSKKDKKFIKVDINQMIQFQEEGLSIGTVQHEDGSRKLKKYLDIQNKRKSEQIEYE